jgi:hypothetical protein
MRRFTLGFGVAVLLAATDATAVGASKGELGDKGSAGGKGGPGPETSTQAGAEGTAAAPGAPAADEDTTQLLLRKRQENADEAAHEREEKRWWDASATYSVHRGFVRTDEGSTDVGQSLFVSVGFALSDHDRLSLGVGALEGSFLVDPGETGLRASDVTLGYSHRFDLPGKIKLTPAFSLTAPSSYNSQLESNVTSPGVSIGLSRAFGDLWIGGSINGRFYWDRYTSEAAVGDGTTGATSDSGSGQANTMFSAGAGIGADYTLPFVRALSIGVLAVDSFRWAYRVGSPPLNSINYGATTDPTFGDKQPVQQSYGFDVHASCSIPELGGFKTSLMVGADNGMGDSWLKDGLVHPYFFYRDSSEVYVSLRGSY